MYKSNKKARLKLYLSIIILACIMGLLACFIIPELINQDTTTAAGKDIPETDTSGFTYYYSTKKNISTDGGIPFINNEILITLNSNQYKANLESYLSTVDGKIVGEITELAQYQILLSKSSTYAEIINMKDTLETFDWVLFASPNYVMESSPDYIPNDSEWKGNWEEVADGQNWGMEAIDAPEAWEYTNQLQTVNIGVIDNMFDIDHPDLHFSEIPLGHYKLLAALKSGDVKWDDHGTHVAGTIAASFDNEIGVAGVSPRSNLYGIELDGFDDETLAETLQTWNIAFYYLIALKQCSVVNISHGFPHLAFEASRNRPTATAALKELSVSLENVLKLLIDEGYQFVICVSAGNQNRVGGNEKYRYYLKDTTSEHIGWDYYTSQDYEDYKKGKADEECKQYFTKYKKQLKKRIEDGGRLDDGNVDAEYDVLGSITNDEVMKRIIVVGSAENMGTHKEGGFFGIGGTKVHNGYKIAATSQCGERVDLIAPGVNIWSTIRNKYGLKSGTSMASPHAAGVAALIFAANPNITGEAAKDILRNSTVGSYGDHGYGLLNAKNAIEAALAYNPIDPSTADSSTEDPSTEESTSSSDSTIDTSEQDQVNIENVLTTDILCGTWDSADNEKRLTFKSTGLDIAYTKDGMKNADGQVELIDKTSGEEQFCTFIILNNSKIAVYLDLEEYIVECFYDGTTLTFDGDSYQKITSTLQQHTVGIIGTWICDEGRFTFNENGTCLVKLNDSTITESGTYSVLDESTLLINEPGMNPYEVNYEIDGDSLIIEGTIFTREGGSGSDTSNIANKICATWRNSSSVLQYIFSEDGRYEYTTVSMHPSIPPTVLESGIYEIKNSNELHLYPDGEIYSQIIEYNSEDDVIEISSNTFYYRYSGN